MIYISYHGITFLGIRNYQSTDNVVSLLNCFNAMSESFVSKHQFSPQHIAHQRNPYKVAVGGCSKKPENVPRCYHPKLYSVYRPGSQRWIFPLQAHDFPSFLMSRLYRHVPGALARWTMKSNELSPNMFREILASRSTTRMHHNLKQDRAGCRLCVLPTTTV